MPAIELLPGDANQDLRFDQTDLVQVLRTGKYLTGQPATWAEGDWNGAPGGSLGEPPTGDGLFNQLDIVAALSTGAYNNGNYAALAPDGVLDDGQTSLVYDPVTGQIVLEPPAGGGFRGLNLDSKAGIFTGEPAKHTDGAFDVDTDWNIFPGWIFNDGPIDFGNVAKIGLTERFLRDDLTVFGALMGGGDLGVVDLVYLCENFGKDLTGLSFVGQNLSDECFEDATLSDANFSEANLSNVDLRGATLAGAVFNGVIATGTNFSNTTGSGFTPEQMYSTRSYQRQGLRGIALNDNDLTGWNFAGQDLTGASFVDSALANTDFSSAVVAGTNFSGTRKHGFTADQLYSTASYQSKQLAGIVLPPLNLPGTDFAGYDLAGAGFFDTWLVGADFSTANLVNANFANANLRGANLTQANLNGANFTKAKLTNADLTHADLRNARMMNADLSRSDLRQTADFTPEESTVIENMIWPDGQIKGLHLKLGEALVVRDQDKPVSVIDEFIVDADARLEVILSGTSFDSTIEVSANVVPQLEGILGIRLDEAKDPADFLGRTFDLFDWNQPLDSANRFQTVELPPGTSWDLSQLYEAGEVSLTEVLPAEQHFSTASVIGSGILEASSVAVADVDGDTALDVIGTSFGSNRIAWYRNNDGQGSFDRAQSVTDGAEGVTDVFAADIDADGDIDVIASSARDNTIAWYANLDGAGTFGERQVVDSNARFARAVHVADLDGDGDMDIVGALTLDNTVAWYPNLDGKGTFGDKQVVTSSAILASDVTAADIDGDGDLDVVSASSGDNTIAWSENLAGDGSSWQRHTITTDALGASSVFVTDIDSDGSPDVLSASFDDKTIAWYRNVDGSGTFGSRQVISQAAIGARDVFASDLDGDGDVDVLSASEQDNTIAWYRNDGDGSFPERQTVSSDAQGANSVYVADVDQDGRVDVLSASAGDDSIAWYRNLSTGEDTQPPTWQIVEVMPNPRVSTVNDLTIVFSEPVTGFDVSDLVLRRDGEQLLLGGVATLNAEDQQTWTLSGLGVVTDRPGVYQLSLSPDATDITDTVGNPLVDQAFAEWTDVRQAGDANLDRKFDQFDIVHVLQADKYLTGELATWEEGDWNGDGVFDQLDVVAALQTGNYLRGPYVAEAPFVQIGG